MQTVHYLSNDDYSPVSSHTHILWMNGNFIVIDSIAFFRQFSLINVNTDLRWRRHIHHLLLRS
jgi:hypothetical protein